uniref:Uncharacterized protein n=1 Tax=Arundo donax TaxID=35708 RepID=A0A0A9H484_ARUDO
MPPRRLPNSFVVCAIIKPFFTS